MVALRFVAVVGLCAPIAAIGPPIPGYGVVPITWEVETTPGGPKYNLTGTVQQVVAQLQELDPNYGATFGSAKRSVVGQQENDKRMTSLNKPDSVCGGLGSARKWAIELGIKYLRTVSGRPVNGPRPHNCGRVSCSYNSSIWWCNDNGGTKTLDSFNNIADSAQVILNNCFDNGALLGGGQENHADNWRGVVKEDNC